MFLLTKGQLVAGNTKAWLMTNSRKEISFSGHTHSGYAASNHTHSNYALTTHTHSQYMTETDVQNMLDEMGIAGSRKTWYLTESDFTISIDNITNLNYYKSTAINPVTYSGFTPSYANVYKNDFSANITINGSRYDISWNGDTDITISTNSSTIIAYYEWPSIKYGYMHKGTANERYCSFKYYIRIYFNGTPNSNQIYITAQVKVTYKETTDIGGYHDLYSNQAESLDASILQYVKITALNSFTLKTDFMKDS